MKKIRVSKVVLSVTLGATLSACGLLNGVLSDTQTKAILTDVAVSDRALSFQAASTSSNSSWSSNSSSTSSASAPTGNCHGNPLLDACLSDAKTYCASDLPTPPSESDATPGPATFEDRRAKMKDLITCLQTNLTSLTTTCQTAVNGIPADPSSSSHQSAEVPDGRPEGHEPRPRGGECHCGGRSVLAACITDAQTLCPSDLPAESEIDNLDPAQRKATVDTLVACLNSQIASVSTGCQNAINRLPSK